ncbi:patatin-like phospholipase family protein [Paucibacter sp. DJ2R-2]|uniref:patatin-like phospholipase family protein n=1 Tax=Paucibacter sp. DJ2R-2 TaxID=2893558 RepID=UPI0021E4F427|nr:cyclic nucleotide-binding and patatin-like phospholipase domain-containing protein [Paucibacter sp. DJ2R-2]MCV2419039.1 cyclic nucleotide-binding domain-containing protein [Paucibacter sp. DJ4R-1]MCV2438006.1 cyclic nucleotide-binding domain-containing protein [Paucibacter sp. DJ2R-2]
MPNFTEHPKHLDTLLRRHLPELLGDIEPQAIEVLLPHLEWVEVPAGQALMTQGEAGDAMYLLLSGRLRTYISNEFGETRTVREIGRGQIVGEMSLFTDEPRSATLVAIRDSVLVRLAKERFNQLLSISEKVSIALTRQIILRLKTEGSRSLPDKPVTIGVLPITVQVDHARFASNLAQELAGFGRVALVSAQSIGTDLNDPTICERPGSDTAATRRIAVHLDQIEAENDFVLLVSDSEASPWTERCCRHCDELLLLADADQAPQLHPIEQQCLISRPPRTDATEILVLLHPSERQSPQGTQAWLARRPLADHVHIRPQLPRDFSRLARLVSRNGVGLVLAGGGARGLAHIGIYRALLERKIEIDLVGGTSIGAVMAALVGMDRPLDLMTTVARRAFASNPTGDFNWLPMISLIRGRRLRRVVEGSILELTGHAAQAEDLWKNFFCVASNYSQAREQVIKQGSLLKSLLASVAIPGALPPVIWNGDLLCDGGTFNNLPADVMRRRWGIGRVIGVDLDSNKARRFDFEEVPGSLALLRDKLRPRAQRRFRLPALSALLMNVTVLCSTSRQREVRKLIDLYFNPPLSRIGMLQWSRFDELVQLGYEHGCEVLDAKPGATA